MIETTAPKPETRQLILQAAQRMFMEQGYRRVSTRQIAAACGITQPALYRHFATKQELYVAVLLDMVQRIHSLLAHLPGQQDLATRLHAVVHLLPTTWVDTEQMLHDIAHELDQDQRTITARAFREQIIEPIKALFQEGIDTGFLRHPAAGGIEAREATYILLRLLNKPDLSGRSEEDRLHDADRMVDLLLYGIACRTFKGD